MPRNIELCCVNLFIVFTLPYPRLNKYMQALKQKQLRYLKIRASFLKLNLTKIKNSCQFVIPRFYTKPELTAFLQNLSLKNRNIRFGATRPKTDKLTHTPLFINVIDEQLIQMPVCFNSITIYPCGRKCTKIQNKGEVTIILISETAVSNQMY